MPEQTDEQLLWLIRSDPQTGLPLLLERYGPPCNALVRRVLYDAPRDAEECMADWLVAAWRNAPQLAQDHRCLRAWLLVTARNLAIDRYRRLKRRPEIPLPEEVELMAEELVAPHTSEAEALIAELVEALPQPDHEIFLRRYYYLQPSREIAEAVGLEEHTVNVRLSRGRAKLKRQFLQRFGKELQDV